MGPVRIGALLLVAIAIPATAHTFDFSLSAPASGCLSVGNAAYRAVPASERADTTVRLDMTPGAAAIRIKIVDSPEKADFVFVDDGDAPPCPRGAIRTVKIATSGADLVAGFTQITAAADYRIYVRSRWLTSQTAAALIAAAHAPRKVASRADRSN